MEEQDVSINQEQEKLFEDLIPEDFKSHKSLEGFFGKKAAEALPKLVESYINGQGLIGKKKEQLLSTMTKEEIAAFLELPPQPGAADDYKRLMPDVKGEVIDELKERMFKLGLNTHQAKQYIETIQEERTKQSQKAIESRTKAEEDAEQILHQEFGTKYRQAIDIAQQAALHLGGKEFHDKIFEGTKDPELVKILYKAGKEFVTPEIVQGSRQVESVETVRDEIERLYSDQSFMVKWRNGDRKCNDKMDALYQRLYQVESSIEPNR